MHKYLCCGRETARSLFCFWVKSSFIRKITQWCILSYPTGVTRGNTSALSESFYAKKLRSRVISNRISFLFVKQRSTVSEPPFRGLRDNVCDSSLAGWKARSRLSIGYNWTFFAGSYGSKTMSANTPNSAFVEGGGSIGGWMLGWRVTITTNIYTPLDREMILLQLCRWKCPAQSTALSQKNNERTG